MLVVRTTLPAMVAPALAMLASPLIAEGNRDYYPHEIRVFVGDTRLEGNSARTLGADYEYSWNPTAGIGLLFEHAMSDGLTRERVFAIPFYAHPYGGLRLAFALINVMEDDEGDKVNRGAAQVSVAHAVEAGSLSVTPRLNVPFVSKKTHSVYSLGFGYNF